MCLIWPQIKYYYLLIFVIFCFMYNRAVISVMVVLIDLKMFMKAKYHFYVEIQIRSQVYNLSRFILTDFVYYG